MNRTITHRALLAAFGAALLTAMTLAARADDNCSTAKAAGNWGFTLTEMPLLPTGAVPVGAVGLFVDIDVEGDLL